MRNPINYLALLGILLWLAWMNYEVQHPVQAIDVSTYENRIDSLQNEMSHLEARRDTIIQRVVSVQVKWREKLVEVRKTAPNDSIKVPVTTPLELDSCREVGLMIMERLAVTEEMLLLESEKCEIMTQKIDVLSSEIAKRDAQIARGKNRAKLAHIASAAVGVGVIVLLAK